MTPTNAFLAQITAELSGAQSPRSATAAGSAARSARTGFDVLRSECVAREVGSEQRGCACGLRCGVVSKAHWEEDLRLGRPRLHSNGEVLLSSSEHHLHNPVNLPFVPASQS